MGNRKLNKEMQIISTESFLSVTALWLPCRLALRVPLTALKSKISSGFAEASPGAILYENKNCQ